MTGKQQIEKSLALVLEKIAGQKTPFELKISDNSTNGDYYTNVALRLASVLKKKPLDIAYEIKTELEKGIESIEGIESDLASVIEKIEVAPPGFVNFFFSENALVDTIGAVNKFDKFGNSDSLADQKIMIEFTDPNPFKEFHIGHLYSNIVGESLSRLFESQQAIVKRVCYQGDVGLHVAKAIYGMKTLASQTPADEADLSLRAQFLGKAYTHGATKYEENEEIKKEINALNKKVYDATDEEINELYEKGRSWSLEYFDSIYARLGCHFERLYFESEVGPIGLGLVREFLAKNIFEESDGAVIFPGKKYGLHNRVFINSLGLPTYEAKELGLAPTKYKEFAYDKSIILTGNEIDEYFKVLLKALELINPDLAKKTVHLSHGMVRLPEGKMSSRTGNVITGEWLLDEVISRIHSNYTEMSGETAERVGLAAVKFAFLKVGVGHDIEFNIEESISLNGASGPYLQYAYVRTSSIINKFKSQNSTPIESESKVKIDIENYKLEKEERELIRQMVYFPEVVAKAAEKYSPNLVAEYLIELAQKFNLFYQKHKIGENEFRLNLTSAVGVVLKNGLNMLGIETVTSM